MFRKRKLKQARETLHNAFMTMPRLSGGCTVTSGLTKTGLSYQKAFAKVKELKGLILEELGDRGSLKLTYSHDGTLTLAIGFSWGEDDEMFTLIREVFYENHQGLFDGLREDELVYQKRRLYRVRDDQTTRIEYEAYHIKPKDIAMRVDRMLDHINNDLDIVHDAMDEEFGEGEEE